MSYKDYLKGITLIENNNILINRKSMVKIVPQDELNILNVEILLNVKFPLSYRLFLKSFGELAFGGVHIYGLGEDYKKLNTFSIVSDTLEERKGNKDPFFPPSFIVIYDLGNGEKYCLDTSKMNNEGECPIVGWYFGRIEKTHEDFGEFFLEKIKLALEFLEQTGHVVNWE